MKKMKKIHFHSDCYFFAGCEAMLINFWKSPELRSEYEISFSYRSSVKYNEGLKDRAKQAIVASVVALIVVLSVFALIKFFLNLG